MAAPKLTSEQQRSVIEWIAEGLKNTEVISKLEETYEVSIADSSVDYYRTAYAEQIGDAQDIVIRKAAQKGYCNRRRRLEALEKNAERAVQLLAGGGKGWTQMSAELRAILKDIRDELGDLKQRHEHSGPGGGAVQVEHGLDPAGLANALDGLLAGAAGGASGGTDALGEDSTDD